MIYQFRRGSIPLFFILFSVLNSVIYAQAIRLTWNAIPDLDVKYYSIYRDVTSNPENEISKVYAPDTSYLDYDIIVGQTYYYRITAVDSADNISEFSDEIYIIADNVTLIELVSFSAEFTDDRIVLQWDISCISDNFSFEIQKSDDGKSFNKIGLVPGRGTPTGLTTYNFVDSDITCGKFYYRLKQIHADGNFEYSNITMVELSFPEKYKLSQNYPNPFSPSGGSAYAGNSETTIKYSMAKEGKVSLIIFDILGREIKKLVDRHNRAGYYEVQWDGKDNYGNNAGSGIYFYRMQGKGFCETKKIVLAR